MRRRAAERGRKSRTPVGSLITRGQYPVCSLAVRATKLLLLIALLATHAGADKLSETAVHRLNVILWQHEPHGGIQNQPRDGQP